jgi:hypothetical protein
MIAKICIAALLLTTLTFTAVIVSGVLLGCSAEGRITSSGASGTIELPPPRFDMLHVPVNGQYQPMVVLVDHKHNREYFRFYDSNNWTFAGPATPTQTLYSELPVIASPEAPTISFKQ